MALMWQNIAAGDNGMGVIGVAPETEIVAVKVLSEYTGSGYFSWIIDGSFMLPITVPM